VSGEGEGEGERDEEERKEGSREEGCKCREL